MLQLFFFLPSNLEIYEILFSTSLSVSSVQQLSACREKLAMQQKLNWEAKLLKRDGDRRAAINLD